MCIPKALSNTNDGCRKIICFFPLTQLSYFHQDHQYQGTECDSELVTRLISVPLSLHRACHKLITSVGYVWIYFCRYVTYYR